jgi:hypothetical protein
MSAALWKAKFDGRLTKQTVRDKDKLDREVLERALDEIKRPPPTGDRS